MNPLLRRALLRQEIQAYLDGHNIRQNVRTHQGAFVEMASDLAWENDKFVYSYDCKINTGLVVMSCGRVIVYYDYTVDDTGPFCAGVGMDETLAHHFHKLNEQMKEYR